MNLVGIEDMLVSLVSCEAVEEGSEYPCCGNYNTGTPREMRSDGDFSEVGV